MAVSYQKVSAQTAAGTLDGTETVSVIQNGSTKRTTAKAIANTADTLGDVATGTLRPSTDAASDVGSTSYRYGAAYFKSGGFFDFGSSDVRITHSSGLLTFSGAISTTGTLAVTGMATLTGGLKGGVQTLTGAGAINLTTPITRLVTTGANALTLADGAEGQLKAIVMLTDGGDGTLTPTNFGNGTTITFNDVGDSVLLVFLNTDWWIVSNNGCTIA